MQKGKLLVVLSALLLIIAFLPRPANAQYRVISWDNFDNGLFPENLQMTHRSTNENTQVFDFASQWAPQGILSGRAATECKRYGLRISIQKPTDTTKIESQMRGVVNKTVFDRRELGDHGRSLYQADFFLPEDLSDVPYSMAVLAMVPPSEGAGLQIYRFGIENGIKIFYSYSNDAINKAEPVDHKWVSLSEYKDFKPGWHRLQIIFEGQERIYCAIDSHYTSFSPIYEPTLTRLQAGIMVTSTLKYTKSTAPVEICYADNLSIQMSPEDVPLPDSPWTSDLTGPAAIGSTAQMQEASLPGVTPQRIEWLNSTDEAWSKCLREKRPILLMFYAPRVLAYKRLEEMLATERSATELFGKFIPLALDANQLATGALLEKFKMFKVPSFVIIGPDGAIKGKVFVTKNDTWSKIAEQIKPFAE